MQEILKDGENSLFHRSGLDPVVADFMSGKIVACFDTFMERLQPVIRAEVQEVFCKSIEMEKSADVDLPLAGKSTVYVESKETEKASSWDSIPSYASVTLAVDSRQFPSLPKGRDKPKVLVKSSGGNLRPIRNNKSKNISDSPSLIRDKSLKNSVSPVKSSGKAVYEQIILIKISKECELDFNAVVVFLKKKINLKEDVGIDTLRMRKIPSGDMFAICGEDATLKANLLAAQMSKALCAYKESIVVSRPRKSTKIFISGKNDFISQDEIVSAVTSSGECGREDIHVSDIIYKSFGRWCVRVTCPEAIGRAICKIGKLCIGWGGWTAVRMAPTPLLRCLRTGHTHAYCKETVDRSFRCFRCGNNSHKLADCKYSGFKCPLCIDMVKDSNHRLGDLCCVCPSFSRSEDSGLSMDKEMAGNGNSAVRDSVSLKPDRKQMVVPVLSSVLQAICSL